MNPLARFVSAAAALAAVWLVSGCAAPASSRGLRPTVTMEFAVMESSTEKELTPQQLAELRQAVADYLRDQGLTDGRTYYVKVTFPSANPNEEPQWAVVRIGSQAERTYTVIAAYPGRDDSYPYDLYPLNYPYSNYYPGYYSFSNWGYYDPFDYNYGYYRHPTPPRNRDDHGKPDQPNKPTPPNQTNQPGHPPTDRPPYDPNRWNRYPHPNPDQTQPHRDSPKRPDDTNRWDRNRPSPRDDQPRYTPRPDRSPSPTAERTYTPRPESSYTPPERTYTPPADTSSRSEPSRSPQSSRDQPER